MVKTGIREVIVNNVRVEEYIIGSDIWKEPFQAIKEINSEEL